MKNVKILKGNCLDVLKDMDDESVQCCITSPPYYALRNYGTRPVIWDGVLNCNHEWITTCRPQTKLGNEGYTDPKHKTLADITKRSPEGQFCTKCGAWSGSLGAEPTPELYIQHLTQIFHEVKRVLKKDGTLWLNIGDSYAGSGKAGNNKEYQKKHKEFGKISKHEERFGLSGIVPEGLKPKDLIGIPWMLAFALRADGWYLRCDIIWHKPNCMPESVKDRPTRSHEYIFLMSKSRKYYYDTDAIREPCICIEKKPRPSGMERNAKKYRDKVKYGGGGSGFKGHSGIYKADGSLLNHPKGKNKRSIWTVNTKPFKGAHFAVFPPELIKPCILAGSREQDIVIDPFGGSGTTAIESSKLNRKSIIIELKDDYIDITNKRLQDEGITSKENINKFF